MAIEESIYYLEIEIVFNLTKSIMGIYWQNV